MARQTLPTLRYGLFFVIAVTLGACVSSGSRDETTADAETAQSGSETPAASGDGKPGFSLAGLFSGKKKEQQEKPDRPSDPIPKKVPIGTVHLVHERGGFVLIEITGMPGIPDQADLMTYSQQGKPTGKLRISPERKGNFLVADILGGHPQANDQVMLFGMTSPDGVFMSGSEIDPDSPEVLD